MMRVQVFPGSLGLASPAAPRCFDDDGEKTRWGGEVKKPIAGGSMLLVKVIQGVLEFLVSLGSAEIVGDVVQSFRETFHKGVALRRQVQELLHRLRHFLAELFVGLGVRAQPTTENPGGNMRSRER